MRGGSLDRNGDRCGLAASLSSDLRGSGLYGLDQTSIGNRGDGHIRRLPSHLLIRGVCRQNLRLQLQGGLSLHRCLTGNNSAARQRNGGHRNSNRRYSHCTLRSRRIACGIGNYISQGVGAALGSIHFAADLNRLSHVSVRIIIRGDASQRIEHIADGDSGILDALKGRRGRVSLTIAVNENLMKTAKCLLLLASDKIVLDAGDCQTDISRSNRLGQHVRYETDIGVIVVRDAGAECLAIQTVFDLVVESGLMVHVQHRGEVDFRDSGLATKINGHGIRRILLLRIGGRSGAIAIG